jgi:hypothetical protein
MTSLAIDAHIRAEQAEEEATSLRLELKAAHARMIALKRIALDVLFSSSLAPLREEIELDVKAFRERWGCDPR